LPGLAKDERVVEDGVCNVADDGDETDDEGPAEAEAADAEAFVEVMCAPLDRLEDLLVALGEAGWDLALWVVTCEDRGTVGREVARTKDEIRNA